MTSQPAGPRHAAIAETLQGIVGRVLRIEPRDLDIEAPFLELGADSLALVEALRGIQEAFGAKLTIRQLFEQLPTISVLASYLEQTVPAAALPVVGPVQAPVAQASVPVQMAAPVAPHPPAPSPIPSLPAGRGGEVSPIAPAPMSQMAPMAPALAPLAPLPASASGLERVLGMQIQAFNQLVAQQLQMMGGRVAPHPPAPSPTPSLPAGRGGDLSPAAPMPDPGAAMRSPLSREEGRAMGEGGQGGEGLRPVLPTFLGKAAKGPELGERQRKHLDALVERYCRKTAKSKELTQRYRPWLADSRATVGFRPQVKEMLYPLARARSRGSRLWDVDGNEYIDITMGMGVHLFGHAPEFLQPTIESQISEGFELGPRSAHSGEAAQLFCELTGMERATFTNSGTEAVMTAIRLARARTGRTKIAMFANSYHGHSDGTLAQSREVDGEIRSFPVAPGIPPRVAEEVMVLEYGSDHSLDILRRHAHELAVVIVEPIQSRRPEIQPRAFLHELRRLTTESGSALIFDEMICGFRLHLGGGQAYFGVRADLATYGKIVGGGLPIGVVAGSAEYMDGIDGGSWQYGDDSRPERDTTFFGGTFCQFPLSMAAARVVLQYLKDQGPALQETLNARTARFAARLNRWLEEEQVPIRISSAHSLFRFQSTSNMELLYYHLVDKGIYVWEWRNCFLSTAHTDADLDAIVQAIQESVQELRQGGFLPEKPPSVTPPPPRPPGGGEKEKVGAWERKGFKPAIAPVSAAVVDGSARNAGLDPDREVLFSLYFFGNYSAEFQSGKYDLILDSARFADRAGLSGVWFPERHFHQFGGLSPNPSVLAAALARETERIALRAGSVVLPLHHPVRVAEEWALVDNLSGGRVGLSYASGWHPNDFALAPESYGNHRELMFERAETIRRLWKGEAVRLRDGAGSEVDLRIYPLPARRDLPVWITIVNNPDTYRRAGEMGAGVLTNLMGQTLDALASNLAIYREALAAAGHPPSAGHVTLLLHTFLGPDAGQAIDTARAPFHRYLQSSLGLVKNALASEGQAVDFDSLSREDFEYMLELAYQRYVQTSALIGSPESVAPIVESLRGLGVDEIACLVDFGVEPALVGESLPSIAVLQQRFRERRPVRAADEERVRFPLTEAQRHLWTVAQLGQEASLAYLEAGVLEMRGPLDATLLRRALQAVVDRHEAVRSVIPLLFESGEPEQEILPELILDLPLVDLSSLPAARREAETRAWLDAESRRPFDLARGPLIRATLLRLDPRVHQLYFCVHHIAADGLSIVILLTEALAIYEAGRAGRRAALAAPYQFREYAAWLLDEGAATAEDEAHWLTEFAGELPVLEPPTDRPRPAARTFRGDRRSHVLGADQLRGLRDTSRRNGATLFIGLLSVWTALLHRWTGQDDVIVGAPTVYRPLEGGDRLVGHSAHLLPYRSRLAAPGTEVGTGGEPTFAQHVAAIRRSVFGAHEHGAYPMERLLRHLDLPRDPSRAPLINSVFNLDPGAGINRAAGLELIERSPVISHAKFDLALHVLEADGALALSFDYLSDLFDPATIDRLAGYLLTLVDGVIADPARPLGDLPLLSAAELRQVVTDWNRTATDYPRGQSIPALFDAVAARDPQAPAVLWTGPAGEESLSYGELRARADRLAGRLRARGVGPEVRVALEMERSAELVVAMLAVLKAGGAYVPLDPADPADRRAYVLEDSGALLLPIEKMIEEMMAEEDGPTAPTAPLPTASPDPQHLAYVIYTSGSTGRPKGVAVPHRGVVRLCVNTDYARLGPHDRVAHVSNTAFDAATFEVWGALLNGALLVVIPREVSVIPERLAAAVRERGISAMFLTATLFSEVAREMPDALAGVRWMMYGGEAAAPERVREVRAAMDAGGAGADRHVVNGYGPTESTTFALTHAVEAGDPVAGRSVPIGRPIANTRAWVVDRLLRPVAPGTPGELILGGDGLARGYLGRPELTAERFAPNPFEEGERVYRTGDLVRARPDGVIEFLGRTDDQVKIRGFRVELGEIETAFGLHPAVREVVVLAPQGPAGRRLVAFAALEPGTESTADLATDLRAFVRSRLPAWMVPSAVAILDALPRTPSGKLDRRALAPRAASLETTADEAPTPFEAPRNPAEEMVAAAWAEVLQRDRVGIHDDFFALGGHSLLAGRILSRLGRSLGTELSLGDFFQEPTVAGLARTAMEARWTNTGSMAPPLVPTRSAPGLPLSFAQERLWLLDQLQAGSAAAANTSFAASLCGQLSVPALARTLAEIVRRHEVLRARFPGGVDGPVQMIDPYMPPSLPVVDLAGLPEEAREGESHRLRLAESGRPFDLARGPLVRATLLRLEPGDRQQGQDEEHVLLLGFHSAVCDDWSAEEVLPAELAALYQAFVEGRPSPLPELPVQYADFADWQRRSLPPEAREARIAWWRQRLGARPPVLDLPADHLDAWSRPRVPGGRGASRETVLSSAVLEGLRDLGRREGATLFMVLLAGLQTLLHRVSGQDRINIGTPVVNRPRTEVEPLIGAFANTLVLPGDLAGNPTVRELLDRVRELTLGAFDHQDLPLEKLLATMPRRRDLSRPPLFQVHFVLRDGRTRRIDLPGVTLSRLHPPVDLLAGRAPSELAFSMVEEEGELRIRLGYSTDLFEASTIERMLAGLGSLLAALAEDPDRRIAELPVADAARMEGGPLPLLTAAS
jgi:natural product biosynthesis luciferase-like monooxygenase protein/amino acid adenylation domain-containing protein